jgi:prevent-host-death family protein
MRTVTKAEAERDFGAVFNAAAEQPVCIQEAGKDMVLISAAEFEEAQELLRKERARKLIEIMKRASEEARANGFTEDMLPELLRD